MVGIVILNYNEWELTIKCIRSIEKTTFIDYKIFLVDNASEKKLEKEIEHIISNNKNVVFIKCKKNKGYSGGNNIGIKCAIEAGCQEILITNNDVIFSYNCIELLRNELRRNENIFVIGPKVYLPDGNIQEINMGCKMTLKGKYLYILRKTPLRKLSVHFVEKFHAVENNLNEPFEVYGVSGCCFMMSKESSRELFPLDENTFLYEEENMIGVKVDRLGKKILYYPPAEITHLGGASTNKMSAFSYGCFIESEIYYCRKYLSSPRFLIFPLFLFRILYFVKVYQCKDYIKYGKRSIKMFLKKLP